MPRVILERAFAGQPLRAIQIHPLDGSRAPSPDTIKTNRVFPLASRRPASERPPCACLTHTRLIRGVVFFLSSRAAILAFARPPAPPRATRSAPRSSLRFVAAPHRSLRSDRGLTVDHRRVRARLQKQHSSLIYEPKPRNERRFVPCAQARGQRTSDSEGPRGPSAQREGGRCKTHTPSYTTAKGARCTTHTPFCAALECRARRGSAAQHEPLP